MSRRPALIIAIAALAMGGAASAQTTFTASFSVDRKISAEENYAAFERIADRACFVSVKDAGSVLDKARQERDCTTRLLTDAVKATADTAISIIHAERTGAPAATVASRD